MAIAVPIRAERFEIHRVANGYVVTEAAPSHQTVAFADMHVFPTWDQCSAWLKAKFEPVGHEAAPLNP